MADDDDKGARRARAPEELSGQEKFEERKHLLDRSVIAVPLLEQIQRQPRKKWAVIIDVNLGHPGGPEAAKARIVQWIHQVTRTPELILDPRHPDFDPEAMEGGPVDHVKTAALPQYVVAEMTGAQIRALCREDREDQAKGHARAIHRIWPDFPLEAHITRSVRTVKCDAARIAYSALGEGITWAVMDSGIDGGHPHFVEHRNLSNRQGDGKLPWDHKDFTGGASPLTDVFGHGTHVAGILAGEVPPVGARRAADADELAARRAAAGSSGGADGEGEAAAGAGSATPPPPAVDGPIYSASRLRDESGATQVERDELGTVSGMAPKAKLLSLKVLDDRGQGATSNLLAAIAYVQQINGNGRRIVVHGVNMSLGYGFDPEWFACGQSPLCVEVDRLVRSGVVVVVAAGNTGYGFTQVKGRSTLVAAGLDLTINDPGNADLAITVGATHRDMPHVYGVSYFSSKGPTGDGRLKPDLLAPGERILSCAAGRPGADAAEQAGGPVHYREDSGTSMAAPHVSGAIAAFLSIREEFIGRPEQVKKIFLDAATDLGRERYFQGRGVVDVIRAIQSV